MEGEGRIDTDQFFCFGDLEQNPMPLTQKDDKGTGAS